MNKKKTVLVTAGIGGFFLWSLGAYFGNDNWSLFKGLYFVVIPILIIFSAIPAVIMVLIWTNLRTTFSSVAAFTLVFSLVGALPSILTSHQVNFFHRVSSGWILIVWLGSLALLVSLISCADDKKNSSNFQDYDALEAEDKG
ncbi:hypothetical protein BH11PSE11_BH11PSE11_18250 [soil metagenome]